MRKRPLPALMGLPQTTQTTQTSSELSSFLRSVMGSAPAEAPSGSYPTPGATSDSSPSGPTPWSPRRLHVRSRLRAGVVWTAFGRDKFGGDPGGIRTRDLDLERVASWARLDDGVYTNAVRQQNQSATIAEPSEDDKLSRVRTPPEGSGGRLRAPLRSAVRSRTRRFPGAPGRSRSFRPHW